MIQPTKKIILASASPRRQEILKQAGIPYLTVSVNVDETYPDASPDETVLALSHRKATAAVPMAPNGALIIGADTIVYHNGQILGKPQDSIHAFEMLKSLQNDAHEVYTGVSLLDTGCSGNSRRFSVVSKVRIMPLTDEQIRQYIHSGEPFDKAGAYAIQGLGALFVEKITGDFYTVVGLPLNRTYKELIDMGVI